jgi:hypothetical protein
MFEVTDEHGYTQRFPLWDDIDGLNLVFHNWRIRETGVGTQDYVYVSRERLVSGPTLRLHIRPVAVELRPTVMLKDGKHLDLSTDAIEQAAGLRPSKDMDPSIVCPAADPPQEDPYRRYWLRYSEERKLVIGRAPEPSFGERIRLPEYVPYSSARQWKLPFKEGGKVITVPQDEPYRGVLTIEPGTIVAPEPIPSQQCLGSFHGQQSTPEIAPSFWREARGAGRGPGNAYPGPNRC